MKTRTKKIFAWVMTFAMLLSLLPAAGLTALAADAVSYRYPVYNKTEGTPYEQASSGIAEWKDGSVTNYTAVKSTDTAWGTSGTASWYVVTGTVEIKNSVTCLGDVNLILTDDSSLTVTSSTTDKDNNNAGICVSSGNSLTVYGQSENSGTLTAKCEAICDEEYVYAYGEYVYAYGAGIGGSYSGDWENPGSDSGAITINGGSVTATGGGSGGAGIGGGSSGSGNNITINGGTVTANGGYDGAGIGGGSSGSGSNITINGGEVTATAGGSGAGIGGCYEGSGSNITINGGSVTANGGFSGAGIGGGCEGSGSNITINGGTVTANGGYGGAGIGGGRYSGSASNIKIATSLTVKADGNNPPKTVIGENRTSDDDLAEDLKGRKYAAVKLQISVTGTTVINKDYDGTTAATAMLGTVSGIAEGDQVEVTATATFSDANAGDGKNVTVTYTLSGKDADKYFAPDTETKTADITKASVEVPEAVTGLVYNGTEQTGVELPEGALYTLDGNTGTNAKADYEATASLGENAKNYQWKDKNTSDDQTISWSIGKLAVTLWSETASKDYDGTALTAPTVYADSSKTAVDSLFADEVTGLAATGSVTYVLDGEVTNEITYTFKEGCSENNYSITKTEGKLIITKAGTMTITGSDYTGVYDGKAHGIAAESSVETGTTVSYQTSTDKETWSEWSETVPQITGAGTLYVKAKAENPNYEDATCEYTLIVNPAKVAVPTAVTGLVYTGEEQTGVVLPDNAVYTLTGNTGTDAKSYQATATLKDTNHVWDLGEGLTSAENQTIDWSIAKADDENYNLKIMASGGGTVTADKSEYKSEETVTLTVTPNDGYTLAELTYGDTDITDQVSEGKVSFKMPASDTTVIAVFEVENITYTVTANTADNGSIAVKDPVYLTHTDRQFKQDDLVGITVTPAEGYVLESLTVKQGDKDVAMADATSFYMPAGDVTVTATFGMKAFHPAVAEKCGYDGNIAYWESGGKYYSDENCGNEISLADTVVKATGNHTNDKFMGWTWINLGGSNGWTAYYATACSVCGKSILENHNATMTTDDSVSGKVTYNATITVDGKTYSTSKTVDTSYTVTHVKGETSEQYDDLSYGAVCSLDGGDGLYDWYVNGTKVKSASKEYSFCVTANITVTSETSADTQQQPVLAFTTSGRTVKDSAGKTKVGYNVTWSLPEGCTLVSAGLKRAYNVGETPAVSQLTSTNETTLTDRNGSYSLTIPMSAATSKKSITAVGYLTYKDASGTITTMYSAPVCVDGAE